jgi:predicted metal-dependent peptidase
MTQPVPADIAAALREAMADFDKLRKKEEQRIRAARAKMIMSMRFWGALTLALDMEVALVGTACTDGRKTWWDPRWTVTLTNAQLRFAWAHEVMHCALQHITRQRARQPGLWNIACDHAINNALVEESKANKGRFEMPSYGYCDPRFKDMSAEQIYQILLEERVDSPPMLGPCHDAKGDPIPGSDLAVRGLGGFRRPEEVDSEAAALELEDHWKSNVSAAAHAARAVGELTAGQERLVKQVTHPPLPWEAILRDHVDRMVKTTYTWGRPDKRYAHGGICLPSMTTDRVGPLAVIVDTSGSITHAILDRFANEISAIAETARPVVIRVYYVDAAVCGFEEFTPDDPIKLHPSGGGGTSFAPAFEHMEEDGFEPHAAVYLTDLLSKAYPPEPEFPVLWAYRGISGRLLEEFTPPFGEMVALL